MTEQEALTKWCPFSRVVTGNEDNISGWNRSPSGSGPGDTAAYKAGCEMPEVNCIASACMAWRVMRTPQGDQQESGGFCGLAGFAGR